MAIIADVEPVPIQDAAKEFGVSVDTLYRLIARQRIRRIRKTGDRRTFVDRDELRKELDFQVK